MNITEYHEKTESFMPLGMAILKKDYYIASADESLYTFLDKNADRIFTELIHPDDRHHFLDAIEKMEEGTQYVLVRMISGSKNYKYMLLRMRQDKFVVDNFRCIEVYISDIITSLEKYKRNRLILTKYRRMMSLVDCLFFDYVKNTNIVNIYMYTNDKGYMFLSENLDVWREQMLRSYLWKDSEKKKFEALYSCLKDGLDDFKIQLATTFFSRAKRSDSVLISGSVLFDIDGSKLVAGVIKLNAGEMEKPYYTTEASKDSATGLMNKRAIMEYAALKLKEADDKQIVFMVIDIDDFKNINDTYGHLFGDKVIFRTAETIKRVVGHRGTVARFGGDEFVVLLEDCGNEVVNNILKTIYGEVGLLFKDTHADLRVTISTGISSYPKDGNSYEKLFKRADKALYVAKGNGKNNYVFYEEREHKQLEFVNERRRVKGLKTIASRANRSILYSEIMLDLGSGDITLRFDEVAAKICDLFDVAGISVYFGEDFNCCLRYGKYTYELQRFSLMEHKDFTDLISEDDMVVVEDAKQMADKSFYHKYQRLEVNANLLSFYRLESVVKGLVCFDVFNTSRQWSEWDMIALNAIGKMILQNVIL
ncbi:MAG: GGDEF domain-containing protein [Lachnospiraceae bacterium]|nr:GGDEF domain-containing protein [Lachnospiraceae bacterium]